MKLKSILLASAMGVAMVSGASAETEVHYIQCGSEMSPGLADHIKSFEAANSGVKINVEVVGWGQCQDKVTTLAAAGSPPAMAYVGSRTLKQFAKNDLILSVAMSDAEKASYWPTIMSTVTFDGKQWGIPRAFSTKAMYYNKDLFKAAGLDADKAPTTWQELYDAAKAVKDNTPADGMGIVAKSFDNTMHQYMNWVYTNGGTVIDGDGNITLDSSNNREALEWYGKMVEVSQPGPVAYDRTALRALFNDSKIAVMFSGPWERTRLNKDIDWAVANLPVGPQGAPGTLLITDSIAVFKGSGAETEAMAFAKLIANPENQFAYEKAQGLTPLRPVEGVKSLVSEDATWAPFLDAIEHGGPEPLFLDYKGFQDVIIDMVQAVVLGEETAADALKEAAAALEEYK